MRKALSLYGDVIALLPPSSRRFLVSYSVLLALLSILDGAAIGLLAMALGPIISQTPLNLPLIGHVGEVGQFITLAIVCLLIIVKGVLSTFVIWRATRRLATFELEIGSRLFDSYLSSSWTERLQRNSADVVRLTDSSVSTMVSGYIRPVTTLPAEIVSFVVVIAVLAITQPLVALIALLYLGGMGAFLFFWVTKRSRQAGRVALRFSLKSSRLITEMVGALKEVTLRNKTSEAAAVVRSNRVHTTRARSNAQFLAQVPRYLLESGLIGGFIVVGIVGYLTGGTTEAIMAIALFGLAGFRMAPNVIRFQAIVSQLANSTPHCERVLTEIRRSEASGSHHETADSAEYPNEVRSIVLDNVSFRYRPESPDAVTGASLTIPFGSTVAFVGASGAGKSTLLDLLLGLIEPTSGAIRLADVSLSEVKRAWRSRVAYVPQDVSLFDATVAQNVALTWTDELDESRVRRALEQSQLLDIIEARDGGIHAPIGERGLSLSGGQRQRLGIARALYSEPEVLVMDEATSALDTATEAAVTEAVRSLRGSITIITVAHRLATVKESDQIHFMRDARVVASGTFEALLAVAPDFAHQARLAGLN